MAGTRQSVGEATGTDRALLGHCDISLATHGEGWKASRRNGLIRQAGDVILLSSASISLGLPEAAVLASSISAVLYSLCCT